MTVARGRQLCKTSNQEGMHVPVQCLFPWLLERRPRNKDRIKRGCTLLKTSSKRVRDSRYTTAFGIKAEHALDLRMTD